MKQDSLEGLIFDIRRFSVHDGPGIRTTVFFKGCPLECWWCHNPESRHVEPEVSEKARQLDGITFNTTEVTGKWISVQDLFSEIIRDVLFFNESNGGVTFSGGEPLLQPAFLTAILHECRSSGIHTAIDTSGYAGLSAIREVGELADLFLYDLKLATEADHFRYTGGSNKQVIENLKYLLLIKKPVQIRIPVVPGMTGSPENIRGLIHLIRQLDRRPIQGISLLPYHPLGNRKYHRFNIDNRITDYKNMETQELQPLKAAFEALELPVTIGA